MVNELDTIKGVKVLKKLDQISNLFCSGLDSFETIRNLHPNETFAQAANDCYNVLGNYMQYLNSSNKLFSITESIQKDKDVYNSLTNEEKIVLQIFLQDFHQMGDSNQREKFVHLNDKISNLSTQFLRYPPSEQYLSIDSIEELRGIPSQFLYK